MPTHQVNLDALIPRVDFEAESSVPDGTKAPGKSIKLGELERKRTIFGLLCKPDFQRDTKYWSPDKIVALIRSFLDGHIIPSIILWYSPKSNRIFVIDGSHRLSAFMAWVNNDYGNGDISRAFFKDQIPAEQRRFAERTAALIEQEIGTYEQLTHIGTPSNGSSAAAADHLQRRANNLALFDLETQWVPSADPTTAERSFIDINENPSTIDAAELAIIKARRKPNAIATRALIAAGTGHKYWRHFSAARQGEIETIALAIYNLLFLPVLETPITTLDLPAAGRAYSGESFTLIFDMINTFNDITPSMWRDTTGKRRPKTAAPIMPNDADGNATLEYLKQIKRVASLVAGNDDPGSLGLFPAVYFYGVTGKFYPPAFLAALKFARDLKTADRLKEFTDVRAAFEDFLVVHKGFINDLGHSKGSRTRPVDAIVTMFMIVLDALHSGLTDSAAIVARLRENPKLKDLKDTTDEPTKPIRKDFRKDVISTAYLRDTINDALRCEVCKARLAPSAMTADHIERKEDGGRGSLENYRRTHPYCNTGYVEAQHAGKKHAKGNGP